MDEPNVKDLKTSVRRAHRTSKGLSEGSIELGYMRGFQAGYEQAFKDHKKGKLNKEFAFKPSRSN